MKTQLELAKNIIKKTIDLEQNKVWFNDNTKLKMWNNIGFYSRDNYICRTWEELELICEALDIEYVTFRETIHRTTERYTGEMLHYIQDYEEEE